MTILLLYLATCLLMGAVLNVASVSSTPEYDSPPRIAKRLGVAHDKVLSWIRSGELKAIDLSENRGKRPRWRVSRDDLDDFLRRRSTGANR